MARKSRQSLYSQHPGFKMVEAYAVKLHERTGKTLAQWADLLRAEGPATVKEQREWLKTKHGLTTNYAQMVVDCAEGKSWLPEQYDPEALVEAMFAGKPALRPIYDAVLKIGLALGPDVKACPCQTIVPLYREHVFAQLKPTTRTRLDLGLALHDTPFSDRLLDTGGRAKKDRITHRIALASVDDVDDAVRGWLNSAYELDAKEADKARKKPAAEVIAPADLMAALEASPRAKVAFEKLSPSHKREHITAIEEATKPQTRARRIARSVERLLQGKNQ